MGYQLLNTSQDIIKHTNDDGQVFYIPTDPANTDYQEYLEWVEDGGVPEEADEKLSKILVKTKKKLNKAK
jgi:hypothetical protein